MAFSSQSVDSQAAILNLRLPGQYFDRESSLHDNWHRSYDARPGSPSHGRYLSPDPLGYPDGPDAYSYVGGDPVNKVDPKGLYQEDIHYYMTYFLGIVAGLSNVDAGIIASANRYIDDNPNTEPFGDLWLNVFARQYYHFTQDGWDTKTDSATRYLNPSNPQIFSLRNYATYSPTNPIESDPSPCAKLQMYGEFLHAYVDTYAHRDQNNKTYGSDIGHLSGGYSPDMTYNHVDSSGRNWQYNEARTLAMEQAVFDMLQNDYGTTAKNKSGRSIAWSDVQTIVIEFNRIQVNELTGIEPKIEILDAKLESLGLPSIPTYDCDIARDLRNKNLVDIGGKALKQGSYAGTILATPRSTEPCK